jgi:uncharacterized protein YuzE
MHWTYDPSVDALTIVFDARRRASRTDEVRPGMLVDSDRRGNPIAIEFLDASTQFPAVVLETLPLPKALLPLSDAAKRAALAPATLRQQIRNKRLAATKWRNEWWIEEGELKAYLDSRAPQGRRSHRKRVPVGA